MAGTTTTQQTEQFSQLLLTYRQQAKQEGLTLRLHVWSGDYYNSWFADTEEQEALDCYHQTVQRDGEGHLDVQLYSDIENDEMVDEGSLLSSND